MTDTAAATLRQTDEYLGSRIQWKTYDEKRFEENELTVVALSPDGNLVAAGSENGKLLLWDSSSGKRLHDAYVSKGVSSIAFDPNGGSIALGSLDGSLLLFNLKTKTAAKLSQEEGVVSVVLYTAPGRLISAAWDGSITIWNTELRSKITRHAYPEAAAELKKIDGEEAARFKKNGYFFMDRPLLSPRHVIKLSKDDSILETEDRLFNLRPIAGSFLQAVPAGDGHSLWAGMGDGIFRVDLNTWRRERLTGGSPLSELGLVPGLRPVVVDRELVKRGGNYFEGRILSVWEPGRPKHKVDGRKLESSAHVLGLSPEGKRLAVSSGNRLDVYRFDDLSLEQSLAGHDLPVRDAAFLPNGSRLATASEDGHVKIWDLERPKLTPSIQAHSGAVTALVFRTFGGEQSIITGSEDGTVKSFPLRSLNAPSVLFQQKQAIRSISLSSDAMRLALVRKGGDVATIELTGATHQPRILTKTNAQAVSFVRDSAHLLLALDRDESVRFRIIDAVTGKVLASERRDEDRLYRQPDYLGEVHCLLPALHDEFAWASDSPTFIGDFGMGRVSPLKRLSSRSVEGGYLSVAVSADGALFAGGSRHGEINVDSTPNVAERYYKQVQGHLGPVTGLAFTSRGTRLISGSEDGSIRVWDFDHQMELLLIRTGSAVRSVAISPDGCTLAAGLTDGTLRLWDAPGAPPN
jgi:WD40 repeat protein